MKTIHTHSLRSEKGHDGFRVLCIVLSPPAAFYICVILSESYLEKQLALQTSEKDLS